MSSSLDWDQTVAFVRSVVPTFIGICIALCFCLIRRRENPRGAVFLGLAVLVSFARIVISFGWYYFMDSIIGLLGPEVFQYVLLGFHAVASFVFWCLIVMAVFARPKHYDDVEGSPFDQI